MRTLVKFAECWLKLVKLINISNVTELLRLINKSLCFNYKYFFTCITQMEMYSYWSGALIVNLAIVTPSQTLPREQGGLAANKERNMTDNIGHE